MSGIKDYSTTPASNTALFPEGMAPSAVNDGGRQVQADIREWYNDAQWVIYGDGDGAFTVAFASATSFTVNGVNVTAVYHAGRRVKAVGSATGTIYGTISSSSFSTNTTVNVTWDSGSLVSEALTISIGILSKDNDSLPSSVLKPSAASTFTAKQTFTKSIETAKGAAVASAATTDIWTPADGNTVHVTGTTTITSFGTAPQAGAYRWVIFDGALTLTHGANLDLPGNANITTAAGDRALVYADTTTAMAVLVYVKDSGNPTVLQSATTSAEGGARLADAAAMEAATAGRAVTADVAHRSPSASKAWCLFDGTLTGTNAPIAGYNVTSVTRVSTGVYTINFTDAFSSADYAGVGMGRAQAGVLHTFVGQNHAGTPTASTFPLAVTNSAGSAVDIATVRAVFFGDQ